MKSCILILLFGLSLVSLRAFAEDTPTPPAKPAAEDGRMNIMEENDYFASNDDRHYTQGNRASYLTPPVDSGDMWDAPFNFFSRNLPIFDGGDRKRKYGEWTVWSKHVYAD